MKSKLLVSLIILSMFLVSCTVPATPATPPAPTVPEVPTVAPTDAPAPSKPETPAATQAASTAFTLTDALGREVKFEKAPERIVLTGKALFMVADAIYLFPEAGERIAGYASTAQGSSSFIPLIDPKAKDKEVLDGQAGPEQVAAVKPDVVILKSYLAEKVGKPIEALGIPVVYIDFETPEQYQRDLNTLGTLFQNQDRAKEVASYFASETEKLQQATAALTQEQKPKTLLVYYNSKDGAVAFNVPPMNWMQTTIVELAGGDPVWKDAATGNGWNKVTLEQIAAWNPENIFVISYAKPVDEVVATLKADSQWQALEAVKNGKLYGFATDIYSWDQPDVRWILGAKWLAVKLHPDLFKDVDMVKETQSFYQQLYGIDAAQFEKDILPLMKLDVQ